MSLKPLRGDGGFSSPNYLVFLNSTHLVQSHELLSHSLSRDDDTIRLGQLYRQQPTHLPPPSLVFINIGLAEHIGSSRCQPVA